MRLFRATAIEKRVLWKISKDQTSIAKDQTSIAKDQTSIAIERMTRAWIPKRFNTYGKGC
ncbi:hypothetical protein D1093_09380 [Bartonella kosoyi]|uniref:Uncharacterized protein n=1 Tax=Bartonella kosoyi TaxID=2133959 RepID=A0A5B9CYJ1_9HYPH|nr:hypothetical protein [Bartonella kosoyi]QEE09769.1 hypothetical protein D1093_09380 [Bartonella kosoyi]